MCPGANEGDSDSGITNIPNKTNLRKKRSDSPEYKQEIKKNTWK